MIERIVTWSLARRGWIAAAVALLAVLGVLFGSRLRFDALPDVTGKQVVVLTRAPGLTPEEVERLVTRPLESSIGGVPGLQTQRSLSRYGISSITAVFGEEVDLSRARQQVQERLLVASGELPAGVEAPELGPLTGGLGEIYHFTLSSRTRSPAELLELAELRVAPLLRGVPGVVEVNTWGGEERTLDVIGDPARMAQHRVTLSELRTATERATGYAPGASLPAGTSAVLLRGVAWPEEPDALAQAVVRADEERTTRLGDVALVRWGARPRLGAATEDGRGESVYVMVQMLTGANALEVLERVHARMPDVRQSLPEDVALHEVYDRSDLVYATLRTVGTNLLEGGLLVVAVLFLMLGSFRAGALVASVIPLSMLGAVAGMIVLDVPGNLMSLGALDFGLLVDGAVVMVEATFHRLHRHGGGHAESTRSQIAQATTSMARPVFYSVLIILLVYVPILSLTGVEGKMFGPMAITVVLALASSLVLSLVYVPAMAQLLLRTKDVPAREPLLVRAAERAYAPVLALAQRVPFAVLGVALALLAAGGLLFWRSGTGFVPQLDEGDLVIQTTHAADVSLETAIEEAGALERALVPAVPEVVQVASRIGSPAVATDIMGLEQADVFVRMRPRGEWREGMTHERLVAEIEEVLRDQHGDRAYTQPIQMRFNELLGGSVSDVTLSIYGPDLAELRALAEQAVAALRRVPGSADVRIYAPPAVPMLEVRPDPLGASMHGMTASDVLDHVAALRTGLEAGVTYDGPVRIPVRVRMGGTGDAFHLQGAPIPTEQGSLLPLDRLARVTTVRTSSLVSHDEAQRRIVVGLNVRGRDLGSVVEEARAAFDQAVDLPSGYRTVWGGQYESLESAKARLAIVIPVVLAMILALLYWLFRRVGPTLIIFLNVPFAAVGGMIALASRGLPVSISAAVGFIALSGIAVLNGVVLMNRLLAAEGEGMSPLEAARDAARSRMRPVLMTALVAALGFVPMTLATGVGAEVQRPLATVVVGGLVTSTLLTLVILPALYPLLRRRKRIEPAKPVAEDAPAGDAPG